MKYVICAKCRKVDKPRKPVIENGVIKEYYNVGTAIHMKCPDCSGKDGYALRCRDCCPSGHETR